MSAKCQFCERVFRSTQEREAESVCMFCHNIFDTIAYGINQVGKKVVDKIIAAVENGSTT